MPILKILGFITVFLSSTAIGFLKAETLKKRADKLLGFSRGAAALGEKIRLCSGEISELTAQCFHKELLEIKDGISINQSYLTAEDITLLREFFSDSGMGDIDSEYERTLAYAQLIKLQYDTARDDCSKLCRLYKSLGALFGIFICIFLL